MVYLVTENVNGLSKPRFYILSPDLAHKDGIFINAKLLKLNLHLKVQIPQPGFYQPVISGWLGFQLPFF
jgi:hypothetical protein